MPKGAPNKVVPADHLPRAKASAQEYAAERLRIYFEPTHPVVLTAELRTLIDAGTVLIESYVLHVGDNPDKPRQLLRAILRAAFATAVDYRTIGEQANT